MGTTIPEEFTPDVLNYFRACHVTANVIPEGLRQLFKQQWDVRYRSSHGEWNNTAKNGTDFYSLTTRREQATKAKEIKIIRNGNTSDWDCTCLFYAILYSKCIGKASLDTKVKKSVNDLRLFRNSLFHAIQGRVTTADFQTSIQVVINALDNLSLDVDVLKKIKTQTSFPIDELREIQEKLEREKKRNEEPQTFCDLPPKPSHVAIQRQTEVDSIIKEMESLQNLYPNEVTHVYLSGNPGCGKSETARQVGEEFFNKNSVEASKTLVATLNASSLDALLGSYIQLASQLRFNEDYIQSIVSSKTFPLPQDKILQLIRLVKPKIEMFSFWLMIVDNVVDLKEVSRFFPRIGLKTTGKGQVLVSSQDKQSIPLASPKMHHLSLSEGMRSDDAVSTLCGISEQSDKDHDVVLQVAEALDFQPLALACAGFYMNSVNKRRFLSWKEILSKIQQENVSKIEKPYLDTSGQAYKHSMTAAVKMAMERVMQEDQIMLLVFQFISVAAQDPMPIQYIIQYVVKCMPGEDEDLIAAHIERSSLIITSEDSQSVRVHQVVYSVLQETLRHAVLGDCLTLSKVIESFSCLNINDGEEPDYDFIISTKSLVPHFLVLQEIVSQNVKSNAMSKMLTKEKALLVAKCLSSAIGNICQLNGKFKVARVCYEMSLLIKEKLCAKKDVSFFNELYKLGDVLACLELENEAKSYLEKALESHSQSDSDDHYTLTLTRLGVVLSRLGKASDAEKFIQKAVPCIEKIENKLTLGRILYNVAQVYYLNRNYKEAQYYMEKALVIDIDIYGENHPNISEKYNDLALVLENFQKYDQAKEYLEKAIAIQENCFDDSHPYLAIYLNNLGTVLQYLKQLERAKECMERAVAIDERVYNDNHPNLAIHLNNLGLVLQDLKHLERAKECMERAVAIVERHDEPRFGAARSQTVRESKGMHRKSGCCW